MHGHVSSWRVTKPREGSRRQRRRPTAARGRYSAWPVDARTSTRTARGARASPRRCAAPAAASPIVPTAPERQRNGDNDHPYRHDSDFHYLTGFAEPGAWLLLDSRRPHDAGLPAEGRRARDLGRPAPRPRRGAGGARRRRGAAARRARRRSGRAPGRPARGLAAVRHARPAGAASTAGSSALRARARRASRRRRRSTTWRRCSPRCASSRTPASWRRCAAPPRSAPARTRARCASARSLPPRPGGRRAPSTRSRPSCCTSSAARAPQGPAYGSIVAAGANACVLHYAAGATPSCSAGELCLIDAGCELDGYASDVTRTFPADGRFSAPQRELYEIVEAAQARRHRRDPARRAPARRARRGGARAGAGHARHRPARPRRRSATSTR